MSQIRKPTSAERASQLRRVADATIDTAQDLKAGAQATARKAQRVFAMFMLGMFTFGALSASSFGATLLGLLLLSPFYYLAYRGWRRMTA
ncbi:hypothetical protein [Sphingomonas humi]|uniref:Uncharacterized protein n=1 Tax=Sphingomonas humi TaxID=335630 RepID=A0ABP7RWW7_9SPHN